MSPEPTPGDRTEKSPDPGIPEGPELIRKAGLPSPESTQRSLDQPFCGLMALLLSKYTTAGLATLPCQPHDTNVFSFLCNLAVYRAKKYLGKHPTNAELIALFSEFLKDVVLKVFRALITLCFIGCLHDCLLLCRHSSHKYSLSIFGVGICEEQHRQGSGPHGAKWEDEWPWQCQV